jgi:hypothetical protein
MVEFTLVVPFLAVILGLTFFFGWAYLHKHQVVVASRYATWQRVDHGAWPTEKKLNEVCFADKAVDVQIQAMGLDQRTAQDLVSEVGAESRRTQTFAEELLTDRLPGGHRGHVAAKFGSRWTLWQQYRSHIHDNQAREGITWRRDEVNCWALLRDQYYGDLDEGLRGVRAPGDGMAQMIRRLYLAHW